MTDTTATESTRSYRVTVQTASCRPDSWSGNGLRFRTADEAADYGRDLAARWTAVVRFRVEPSDEAPNR